MYRHASNNQLLQGIRNKDIKSFNELYNRLAIPLLDTAFKKTNDRPLAQDMVQDLFIWIWKQAPSIHDVRAKDMDVEAYLFTALRNKIYNHYERLMRTSKAINTLQAITKEEDHYSFAEIESREIESVMISEVESLPGEMKKIFKLSRQEGMSIKEIATTLSLSEQTVKNQISTATRRLRTLLHKIQSLFFW